MAHFILLVSRGNLSRGNRMVAGQLGLKSSRPASQVGLGSTRPGSNRPGVDFEKINVWSLINENIFSY